ncbi:MAG TPA: ferritin-like domain-containing protein [Longimicrobium sp.]
MDTDTTRLDMGTAPPATAEILEGLNDLLQLDHDAVGAYEIAMEKLQDRDHADQIAGFRRDHERHIRELNELVAELGGTPANQPHATGPFKLALQSLGGLAGDRGTLMAFRTNELQVRAKYDAYAARANAWPTHIKRVIDACALDEERHYRWVSDVLGKDENEALDKIDTARERAAAHARPIDKVADAAAVAKERVLETTGLARERAADLAGAARERVTGGVDAVRNRLQGVLDRGHDGTGASAAGEAYDGVPAPGGTDRLAAVRGRVDALAGGARRAGVTFEERFQEQPLQTLLIAGIAGFVIGRLLR